MDQIISLRDFPAPTREERLKLARREYPGRRIMYVGRPSPLGNPYDLFGEEKNDLKKVEASIAKYRVWLWGKIKSADKDVIGALAKIDEDMILACWCYPRPCHSQVIWSAWHYFKQEERNAEYRASLLRV